MPGVVNHRWHPTCQPSQAQGGGCKVVEEGEDNCTLHWSKVGPLLFAERHFLLAKIPDACAVVPLGAGEHVQQK